MELQPPARPRKDRARCRTARRPNRTRRQRAHGSMSVRSRSPRHSQALIQANIKCTRAAENTIMEEKRGDESEHARASFESMRPDIHTHPLQRTSAPICACLPDAVVPCWWPGDRARVAVQAALAVGGDGIAAVAVVVALAGRGVCRFFLHSRSHSCKA
jgi:hypothetical protein